MAVRRGRLHYLFIVTPLLASISLAREGQIRLAGPGSTRCSGRVEVYHNNSWGTVCDDGWDLSAAQVVCRQMDCGTALTATIIAEFGEGSGQIWLDDVGCSGSESSLTECQHNGLGTHDCGHSEDAGVVCSRALIRLAGAGSTRCSGRVEVYHNRQWGTVCDDDWDLTDAQVVCRQMNCGTALMATGGAEFGEGSGQTWLNDVGCSGSESSLTECKHAGFDVENCGHGEDAGVVCSRGQIRLVGQGSTQCSGRVEVYHNKQWGTVCDDDWDLSDAQVVCRQLNCGTAVKATQSAEFGQGSDPIWLDDVGCSGSESTLTQCGHRGFGTHDCMHDEDAGVVCSRNIPKPSISVSPSETVQWGQSVRVSCTINSELLGGTFILRNSNQDVQTSDSNPATFNLPPVTFDNNGPYYCVYQKVFSGRSFSSPQSDSVTLHVTVTFPKPHISVTPSKEVKWGQTGVSVTCSITTELSGGTFTLRNYNQDVQTLSSTHATFYLHRVTFDSGGPYHCVYQKDISGQSFTSPQSDSVTIKVSVELPQPTICVSSPDEEQQCSSDTVHVTRGHSFVISCSVHSDVPEGLLVLIFSGSNSDVSEAAVNHSASFHFPVSQDEHQGNYSCVYQVTGAGQTYTSETAPVKIIIKLPLLLVVGPSVAGGLLLLSLVFLLLCLVLKKRSTDERSDTNVQAQMSDTVGNQYVEDSDEDEADYVNVDEPKYTDTKHDSNQPMRSNPYTRSRTADSQDMADKVRFVKVSEACFVEENREDDDYSDEDDEDDYVNVTEINSEEKEDIYQNF